MSDTVKRVMKTAYLLGAVIAAACLLRKEAMWASGFMAGIVWSIMNYSLTVNMFEMALLRRDPKKLGLFLIIKFPVLYLAGFYLLVSRLFPTASLLAGIGLSLAVIGVVNVWPKRA